jgi:crossover junction endodeoxyribonuclease RuvC
MPKQSARAQWAARLKDGTIGKGKGATAPRTAIRTPFRGTILGIDPSLRGTGLAILRFEPRGKTLLIASETVSVPAKISLTVCLGRIALSIERIIAEHNPDVVAIEETIYVQNFQTAQKLGAARGAAIGQAAMKLIPVYEYSPLRIKQSVAGYGRASKEQIAGQIAGLLGLSERLGFDESDAAAVAFCHALTLGRGVPME